MTTASLLRLLASISILASPLPSLSPSIALSPNDAIAALADASYIVHPSPSFSISHNPKSLNNLTTNPALCFTSASSHLRSRASCLRRAREAKKRWHRIFVADWRISMFGLRARTCKEEEDMESSCCVGLEGSCAISSVMGGSRIRVRVRRWVRPVEMRGIAKRIDRPDGLVS
jgi:hypothetical protein